MHAYRKRLLALVNAPASEPLTLTETKLFLRVDTSSEDTLIADMIAAAREAAEYYLRRSLITQTWKVAFDDYTPEEVYLPRGPVQSVTSVTQINRDSSSTVISSSAYTLNAAKDTLRFDSAMLGFRIEIVYVAGFGASASSVPLPIRQGMLAHIAAMYEKRDRSDIGIPPQSIALYRHYREISL